jgi:ATP-dependent NAD(P)H-hydrate dehydratase
LPLEDLVKWAREHNLPLVIDGSGINFIAPRLSLIQGYKNCILTPNIAEFGRLAEGVGLKLKGKIGTHWQAQVRQSGWNTRM